MIIPEGEEFTDNELEEIESILADYDCTVKPIPGATRTIYTIHGDEREQLMINRITGLPYVSRLDNMQSPYKLMDKKSDLLGHRIEIGGRVLGKDLLIIAGHCAIDPKNPQLFIESAHAIKEAGAHVLRGGVWKPRTSPHSYQGDTGAMKVLIEAHEQTGLPVNAEVMDEDQLKIAIEAGAHMLQVGARNALNYSLLKKIGELTSSKGTVVLLKRGMHMGSMNEFICAAEYIVAGGNSNVVMCPRGTVPAVDGYRNYPDECITPLLTQKTWAPVVVDPSHSVGKAMYVPHAALPAIAYGADGIIVEANIDPKKGIGDDPKQAMPPDVLTNLVIDAHAVYEMKKKYMGYLS